MAKYKRMINCEFINASSFKLRISNKAKLLYFYFCFNADDYGFVANADELITLLNSNDYDFHNQASCDLLEYDYKTAVSELQDKGLLFVIHDNYENNIYLIRHWFAHNTIPTSRITPSNYEKYLEDYTLTKDNIYIVKGQCNTNALQLLNKCNTNAEQLSAQSKVNKNKVNESKVNNSKLNKYNNIVSDYSDIDNTLSQEKNKNIDYNDESKFWTSEKVSEVLEIVIKQKRGEKLSDSETELLNRWDIFNESKF